MVGGFIFCFVFFKMGYFICWESTRHKMVGSMWIFSVTNDAHPWKKLAELLIFSFFFMVYQTNNCSISLSLLWYIKQIIVPLSLYFLHFIIFPMNWLFNIFLSKSVTSQTYTLISAYKMGIACLTYQVFLTHTNYLVTGL